MAIEGKEIFVIVDESGEPLEFYLNKEIANNNLAIWRKNNKSMEFSVLEYTPKQSA